MYRLPPEMKGVCRIQRDRNQWGKGRLPAGSRHGPAFLDPHESNLRLTSVFGVCFEWHPSFGKEVANMLSNREPPGIDNRSR